MNAKSDDRGAPPLVPRSDLAPRALVNTDEPATSGFVEGTGVPAVRFRVTCPGVSLALLALRGPATHRCHPNKRCVPPRSDEMNGV